MRLYVDDLRPVPNGWKLARTVRDAIEILRNGNVEELSLDYMIGDSSETNFSEVARFVTTLPPESRPKRVYLHTSSSAGARHLQQILDGYVEEILRR